MYYTESGLIFNSKIKAIEHQTKTNENVNFYYYDDIYAHVNWKLEPPLSLEEYYKEQALRIRNEYDYVILCFSGGLDSTHILETFYYNNIKLDKIITVGAFSQDSSSTVDENMNIEAYTSAFPHIDKLGLSSISEKIDYTQYFNNISQLPISKYGSEWIDNIGSWFSPHHFFWRDIESIVVPNNMRDKKTALIFGKERPHLICENKKLGFRFKDVALTNYGASYGNEYCDRVYFYQDHRYPNILLKQLHILKRVARARKESIEIAVHKILPLVMNYTTSMGGTKNLIYDIRHKLDKKSPKNKSRIFSTRDNYLKNCKTSEVYEFYKNGIQSMKNRIGDVNNQKIVTSRFYEIE